MNRQSLAAAVAVAPLLAAAAAGAARAETQITTATTTPVATATVKSGAADDITITASGSVSPTTTGAAVTVNSSNTVANSGQISTKDVDGSIGILVQGGNTGAVTNSGGIVLTESYTAKDTNENNLPDEPWAKGSDRFGIKVVGPGVFVGNVVNAASGGITIQGNDSAGIWIETGVTGSLTSLGSISVTGDNTVGVAITTTGSVSGDVVLAGTVLSKGVGAQAVDIEGAVGGKLQISGGVTATGYRATDRTSATAAALKTLLASEMAQGGPAVSIAGDIGTGVLITAAAPTGTKADDKTTDADKDGVVDSAQTAGAITSLGGSPALQIGSADSGTGITLGLPSAGDFAFGLINNGAITANGVWDKAASPNLPAPVSATAIQIGVAGGGTVTIAGGLRNAGAIQAAAVGASSTAIHLSAGASVPAIVNTGTISSVITTPGIDIAYGIVIDSGATVTSLDNSKTIGVLAQGSGGFARAVIDHSGTLATINNTGTISAAVAATNASTPITGDGIAFDLRFKDNLGATPSTTSVTITQSKSTATGATDPSITGHIFFGDGDDILDVKAGTVTGAMVFAGGQDTLNIDGGATVTGGVYDSDGKLTVNLTKGTLSVANPETINATTFTMGGSSTLLISADPQADASTKFVTSGDATFGSGATIGLTLQSLLTGEAQFVVLTAGGTLTTGTFNAGTLAGSPFLYTASARAEGNSVILDVHPKTAAELGFSQAQAAAYNAILGPNGALLKDSGIEGAILSQTTQEGLFSVYDQLLPDMGEGVFEALDAATQSIASLTRPTSDAGVRQAGTSQWLQEVNERVERKTAETPGSFAKLFGVVGGYEYSGAGGGALGFSLAYLNVQETDKAAAVNEHVVGSVLEAGAYYRRAIGGFRFSVRGSGGYIWLDGDRRFVAPGVARLASSSWTATFLSAHAELAYELGIGRFYARPEVSADYFTLNEGAHSESGAGDGFDLTIERRKSDRLSGRAILVVGRQWGREIWLRTELRGGYRHIFSGGIGDTVASFNGGTPFTLTALEDGGWATVGFSIKAGTALSYVALEGDADFRDDEQRYNLRLAGRSTF
jgi:hypothetical protein